ncbi:MAG TPA: hypothetical protein VE201_10465, partial [Nitrospirales bacterium]|nr:hypothetical protein [Nitrospirales bacterium]
MEVVDEWKDLFWWSFDARRALDAESVRLGCGIDEKSGEQNDHHNSNYFEHGFLRCEGEISRTPV